MQQIAYNTVPSNPAAPTTGLAARSCRGSQEHAGEPAPDPDQDIDADVAGQKSGGAQDDAANDVADEVHQFVCVKSSKHENLPFCLWDIVKSVRRGRCGFAAQALDSYDYDGCPIFKL